MNENNFIVTNGGSEALSFALASICDDGDEVIIPEPYYANYNGFTGSFNINVVAIPSDIESGFALPKIEDFEKKLPIKLRLYLYAILVILQDIYILKKNYKNYQKLH